MTAINLRINNAPASAEVEPRTHLADFLRERLDLTGTHLGCEHGICGACTVLIDGRPVRACITLAVACDDQDVRTIEGFGDDEVMAALREAFAREHALQCGFCTPGMLIAARDIVLRLPHADEERIRRELSGNICRCTGYLGIVRAVKSVLAGRAASASPRVAPAPKVIAVPLAAPVPREGLAGPPRVAPRPQASAEPVAAASRQGWTRFEESFVIDRPPDEVWAALCDFRGVAACLPGAELTEHDGRYVKGRMRVKLGPIQAAFAGSAAVDLVDATRSGTIRGAGSDGPSNSRTKAEASFVVERNGTASSNVSILVEYMVQGPLAQFSRSELARDLGSRLVAEFAANLSDRMGARPERELPASAAPLEAGGLLGGMLKARILVFLRTLFGRS